MMAAKFIYVPLLSVLLHAVLITSAEFPFRNVSLSWEERLDDLIPRLYLDEIASQMTRAGYKSNAPTLPIARLGIGPYNWVTECLRGDVDSGNATSFAMPIGMAASFSVDLLTDVGTATSVEVRAKYNNYTSHGIYKDFGGLSCFSPVINIVRHPLWGRIQETYGEDPFITGELAKAYVAGLHGDDARYVRTSSGCKHIFAYDGPEDIPSSRFSFNSVVNEADMQMTYLPMFHECVKAGTFNLVCSYNSINGIPACASKKYLTDVVRNQWGFKGYVSSDDQALEFLHTAHDYTTGPLDSTVAAVQAGCNLELTGAKVPVYTHLTQAVQLGLISMEQMTTLVRPLFYTRMRLGLFDPPEMNPYTKLNVDDVVESTAHQELAVSVAARTFVLLKHIGKILPVGKIGTVAVVGPMADSPYDPFGDYPPGTSREYITTAREGLMKIAYKVKYAGGCDDPKCDKYNRNDVINAVTDVDFVVVCLGTGTSVESESRDRPSMDLPGSQLQLLQDAVKYAKGRPVVLLLFNAGPLNVTWADESPDVHAIVECWLPAQAAGLAVARFMTNGPDGNPAGRLPFTWPASMDDVPPMTNYSFFNRSYRYFTGTPFYPFGYGLSFTEFTYDKVVVSNPLLKPCDDMHVSVTLTNVGNYAGDEVIQVYIGWPGAVYPVPKLQLGAFLRVQTTPQNQITNYLTVPARVRAVYNGQADTLIVQPGKFYLYAGGQQPGQKRRISSNVLTSAFTVVGSMTKLSDCPP
ncbi:probable beta-D-xylosidase 6 [Patiria miniata]|uniref:Fibronectin type III-like domain-containing protein n=1 Tax=Patiria miniata TaxID=46514 RepID=A0A914B9C4_PATMI|nr:probable beta-D-xylosidase 6 [Patiria miniata]XP_038072716.1 probable beta-D-xylosidase 6 [Patiria miniata]